MEGGVMSVRKIVAIPGALAVAVASLTFAFTSPGGALGYPPTTFPSGHRVPGRLTIRPFYSGSASLTVYTRGEVAALAIDVKYGHVRHVSLTGYSDSYGSAAGNKAESLYRAETVKSQLLADLAVLGIRNVSISTVGAGSANPVVSNATKQGRMQNRRVVAIL
jgi:outer membrane protein OmpA-like peptidoglycan-associated protein